MLRYFFIMFFLFCGTANANWDDPGRMFDMTKNKTNQTTVVVIATDNVQATCERESRSRGFNGFGYGVNACSFFNTDRQQCTIIVGKSASMHSLGHEFLHCIQGNWHQ